eukprot:7631134-Ditylum_brightwellii.AAC.1
MDNETSKELIDWIEHQQETRVELTPLDMHQQNLGERAIQTWKDHIIVRLAGLPKEFPLAYWCSLVLQTNMTLSLMRPCCMNPALSTEVALNRCYNFNATPMAPLSTKVLVHIKPNCLATCGFHALLAWYIGPTMQHYCCYKVMMHSTGAKRVTDIVRFHHHNAVLPQVTQADCITKATQELQAAMHKTPKNAPPTYVEAVQCLCKVFEAEAKRTKSTAAPPIKNHRVRMQEKYTTQMQ